MLGWRHARQPISHDTESQERQDLERRQSNAGDGSPLSTKEENPHANDVTVETTSLHRPAASMSGRGARRPLIRILAFAAILSYGILIVSSPKHLKRVLDAAFDVSPSSIGGRSEGSAHRGHIVAISDNGNSNAGVKGESAHNTTGTRISFELHDRKTFDLTNAFNLYVKCPLGKVTTGKKKIPTGEFRSGELPPSLVRVENERDSRGIPRSGRVLDFTTKVSTNLKLLLIGDSVMVQLAQAFDEMAGGLELGTRKVVWEAWRGHDGGTMVAPTFGGGATALWRMTALLSKSRKGQAPANSAGGGWSDVEIDALTGYSYPVKGQEHNATIGRFDVVVHRVMHGWMKVHEITYDRLVEAVELAGELLGATTVVVMTVPFTNNVKTLEEMDKVKAINDDIRQIARGWHQRENSSVRQVLVMEYGYYYDHIIWSNARHLGYNVTHPLRASRDIFELEGPEFLLDRLKDGAAWSASIPMVCSDTASLGPERNKCDRNYLFSDGMHTCPESLAARYAAGLACLIGCAHNKWEGGDDDPSQEDIGKCEKECNDLLSVLPVDESWVDSSTTLASFAIPR